MIVEETLNEAQKEMAKEAPLFKEKPRIDYQILDKDGKLVDVKKSWWKKILGCDFFWRKVLKFLKENRILIYSSVIIYIHQNL